MGSFDPLRLLASLQEWYGDDFQCDMKDAFEGHVEKYIAVADQLGQPRDNVVVLAERRKAQVFSPRFRFRLRINQDHWIGGKVDRRSLYLNIERDEDLPEEARSRFVGFLRSIRLGEFTIEVTCEGDD
jgi:hypothetical protein